MKLAFIFPGQGSQRVGMGKALADALPEARAVFEEADRELGMSLSTLCFEGPEDALKLTAVTQPAILATSVAALRALQARGVSAHMVAGHSLGEYSALVAAGALRLGDALRLVRNRGMLMQEAVPPSVGAMAALLGCDAQLTAAVCEEASSLGVCSPANLNSNSQVVIAGHRPAVERAVELAKDRGARKTVMLSVSAPFHCELMGPAVRGMEPLLAQTRFSSLEMPLITNVDARPITSGNEAREALLRQIASPVRWNESVRYLLENGVRCFIEVGPGKVLSGLIKQINRESKLSEGDCRMLNVEDPASLEAAVIAVHEQETGIKS